MANTGRNLIDQMLAGSELATGRKIGKLSMGYRADLLVLDDQHSRLVGRRQDDLLDSWIFSGNQNMVKDVYVGGKKVIENGRHANEESINDQYLRTLESLSQ